MKQPFFECSRWRICVFVLLSLFPAILFTGAGRADNETTIPVMVDYFDLQNAGAVTPEGIARIPGSGNYAILDEGEAKLIIADSRGMFLGQCDTTGFGSNDPTGITYISSGPQAGNFAVTDEGDREVYIVNSACGLQDQFDTSQYGSKTPQGIAFISSGTYAGDLAYTTPGTPDEVFIVSIDGSTLRLKFAAPSAATNPYGLTWIDSGRYAGNLAIMDLSTKDVFIVDTNGIYQDQFDISTISTAPHGICFNSGTGNLDIIDKTAREVFTFNAEGVLFDAFATNVYGSTSPRGLTHVSSGPMANTWAVIDNVSDTVFFVNTGGILQDSCVVPAGLTDPSGIAYIPETGHLAILDAGSDDIYIVDTDCALQKQYDIASFGIGSLSPRGMTHVSGARNFAFVDSSKDAALFVNLLRPGRITRQFSTNALGATNPFGLLLIPPSSNFAVVDRNLNEVYVVNQKGVLQARFDTSFFSLAPEGMAYDPINQVFAIVDPGDDEVSFLRLPALVLPGKSCMCDLDHDGDVDGADLIDFAFEFGQDDCY